ncbi:hypothetical protein ACT3TE_10435 [Brachybacterium sp. AOP42-B2-9]|uniref:hypothetical protein n=1 Tax=Brachybacterium sp. AOP42-B2-9 TaxID=3457672 RepID=UPI003FBA210E
MNAPQPFTAHRRQSSGGIAETFDRGEPWTVQRSVDQGEPEETAVSVAVFAGR